jgi:hypothetical protein
MVIVIQGSWPLESQEELQKRFQSLPAVPDNMTLRGPYTCPTKDGLQSIAIYEVDQSKFAEAIFAVANRYTAYIGVPGFSYDLRICAEPGEADRMAEST